MTNHYKYQESVKDIYDYKVVQIPHEVVVIQTSNTSESNDSL